MRRSYRKVGAIRISRYDSGTPEARRFPEPWTVEELKNSCIIHDATGQTLGYFYFDD